MSKADPAKLGYIGAVPGSNRDSDSWFTPKRYIDAVRNVLGVIDFDPFSSKKANEVVAATAFYTQQDNALEKDWGQRRSVFMNPPYGRGLCPLAVGKFCEQYKLGAFSTAVVLVNNATETRWFQDLLERASAVCFVNHRISFWNADGKSVSGNTRGQVFFYFGRSARQFKAVFGELGFTAVLRRRS